eukprot:3258985-Prymnesium_polylepis.1
MCPGASGVGSRTSEPHTIEAYSVSLTVPVRCSSAASVSCCSIEFRVSAVDIAVASEQRGEKVNK